MGKAEHIVFVCPRFPEGPTVGGAETLLKHLAQLALESGRKVSFLTTCARNHFTWDNEIPAGNKNIDGIDVHFFPVDNRDTCTFLTVQDKICKGKVISEKEELLWINNSVNSTPLYTHLREHSAEYDKIVTGPYLFGIIHEVSRIAPEKTVLVPCLHDEPYAYLKIFNKMFNSVSGFMFNTHPEEELAIHMHGISRHKKTVVGIGISPFNTDKNGFKKRTGLSSPYIIYSGRREVMKGTPLILDYLAAFRARTGIDLKFVITGTGEMEIPRNIKNHVIDLGFVSEDLKHEAMAGAVAFCHPSIYESLGIVILESWMALTPVIVHANSTVLRYQCQQSNGGLWFRTYTEFEEELLLLINNQPLAQKMAESGRKYVLREYTKDAVKSRMMRFLDDN